jgi:ABC-type sugar transport system permease subunit
MALWISFSDGQWHSSCTFFDSAVWGVYSSEILSSLLIPWMIHRNMLFITLVPRLHGILVILVIRLSLYVTNSFNNTRPLGFKRKLNKPKTITLHISRSVDTIPDLLINKIKGVIKDFLTKKKIWSISLVTSWWTLYKVLLNIVRSTGFNFLTCLDARRKQCTKGTCTTDRL